jgi:hypothetical protein
MNVIGFVLLRFYILEGESLWGDYIKFYKLRTYMIMQKKIWMTSFLFKKFFSFFKKFVSSGISLTNIHVPIINGHDNHVTLEAILQAQEMGLDMIILPSHTSHDLQPLDVFCLKLVKTTFEKVRNATMYRNNHMEPYKITLVGWVDQTLEQSLKINKIKSRFKATCIWPFNPKAMDNKTQLSQI